MLMLNGGQEKVAGYAGGKWGGCVQIPNKRKS